MKIAGFDYSIPRLAFSGGALAGSVLAVTLSPWESIRIIGLVVLTAAGYGIVNDQIGCRKCIEYFTLGHTNYHKRVIPSDSSTLNGLIWGVQATWFPALIGGGIMAITSRLLQSYFKPIAAKNLFPILAVGAVAILILSLLFSMWKERQYKIDSAQTNSYFEHKTIKAAPGFQDVDLNQIPKAKRAAWLANSDRNLGGYLGLLVGVGLLTAGMIGFRLASRV